MNKPWLIDPGVPGPYNVPRYNCEVAVARCAYPFNEHLVSSQFSVIHSNQFHHSFTFYTQLNPFCLIIDTDYSLVLTFYSNCIHSSVSHLTCFSITKRKLVRVFEKKKKVAPWKHYWFCVWCGIHVLNSLLMKCGILIGCKWFRKRIVCRYLKYFMIYSQSYM